MLVYRGFRSKITPEYKSTLKCRSYTLIKNVPKFPLFVNWQIEPINEYISAYGGFRNTISPASECILKSMCDTLIKLFFHIFTNSLIGQLS